MRVEGVTVIGELLRRAAVVFWTVASTATSFLLRRDTFDENEFLVTPSSSPAYSVQKPNPEPQTPNRKP